VARVDATGVHVEEPAIVQGEWNHKRFVDGSSLAGDGGW